MVHIPSSMKTTGLITALINTSLTSAPGALRRFSGRLLVLGVVSLLACLPTVSQASLNIFACEPEWASLARELGGDRLEIYSATTALQDPHHVQARPSLIAKMRQADLIVCSGAELEIGWLPLLLRKAGNSDVASADGRFFAAEHVTMLDVPERVDRSMGDVHEQGNPHVHTSPENILLIARALTEKLASLDKDNSAYYQQRHDQFRDQWRGAMQRWQDKASSLKGLRVITHHRFWSYMNQWLGIELVATLEPLPGVKPSSSYLARLIKTAEEKQVQMIMHVSYVNEKPATWLSGRTGLPVVALPASADFQAGESLLQWFDGIVNKLVSVTGNDQLIQDQAIK